MKEHRRENNGFTLVEVLIVVALIAVLMTLLLPAVKRAQQHARATKCMSNLQQIGRMFQLYVVDNEGYLPPLNSQELYNASAINKDMLGMVHALGRYYGKEYWSRLRWDGTFWRVGNPTGPDGEKAYFRTTTFVCPDYDFQFPNQVEAYKAGYGESTWVQSPGGWGSGTNRAWAQPRPMAAVKDPSTRVHVGETWSTGSAEWHISSHTLAGIANRSWDFKRHNDGGNVLFVDGHVKWFAYRTIVSPNARGLNPTNTWGTIITPDLRLQ